MSNPRSANRSAIPILTYHQIAACPPRGAGFRSLYVTPLAFSRQMAWLSFLGYRGLSMSALMPYLRGELSAKVVGISFDDGYLNNLDHALPVLKRHGFSSTCYVVSQRLGKTNDWDSAQGVQQTPLMTAAQLRAWIAGGQEVGAHTRHHVHLSELDEATCRDEIGACRTELEDLCGTSVRHFCYPYGDFRSEQAELVRMLGFESATTTQRGRCHAGEDLMRLPRVPVLRATALPLLWCKLATAYEDQRRQS